MIERKKLMELLSTAPLGDYTLGEQFSDGTVNKIADYLFANGVIVPSVKVGDRVYINGDTWGFPFYYENKFIYSKYFVVGEIISIIKNKKQMLMKIRASNECHTRYKYQKYSINAIGKTVFLTHEEAEKTLKMKGE